MVSRITAVNLALALMPADAGRFDIARRHVLLDESLVSEHAGHAITRPYTPTTNLNGTRNARSRRMVSRGGTPGGTVKAREDSWTRMLAFVERALR